MNRFYEDVKTGLNPSSAAGVGVPKYHCCVTTSHDPCACAYSRHLLQYTLHYLVCVLACFIYVRHKVRSMRSSSLEYHTTATRGLCCRCSQAPGFTMIAGRKKPKRTTHCLLFLSIMKRPLLCFPPSSNQRLGI